MIPLPRNDQLANEFFERIWDFLLQRQCSSGEEYSNGYINPYDVAQGRDPAYSPFQFENELRTIITASPEQLEEYVYVSAPSFVSNWNLKPLYDRFNTLGLLNTYKPKDFIREREEQFHVCPYCNRQYITTGKSRRIAEMDHFYPKDITRFPYLAMSFYNLIPACPSCNRSKSNKDIRFSPYLIKDCDRYLTFKYTPQGADFLNDKNLIDVTVSERVHPDHSYRTRLELDEHYKYHNDYVLDLLKRKRMYDDSFFDGVKRDFPDLFANINEMRRVVWGNYTSKEDLHKRPLAKLTRDILRDIDPRLLDD